MGGQFTLDAKLLASANQAQSKQLFPIPIGNHAGGQWIARPHEPLCQRQSIFRLTLGKVAKNGGHPLGDLVAKVLKITSILQAGLAATGAGEFPHDWHRDRFLLGQHLRQCGLAFAILGEFRGG